MSKIDELMRQGLQLHQAGRIAEAEAIYLKVLATQPSHGAANHLIGLVFLQRGEPAEAVLRLQRAVHVRGNDPEYLGNLGTALNAAGRPREALEAFDRALKLRPANPGVLNNKGMALKALGRVDDAIAAYRAALALAPSEDSFHHNLGNALSSLGDWHGAEAAFRAALSLRANTPNALTGLCLALEGQGRNAESIALAADDAARFPGESEYARTLGHAHWRAGDPEKAASAYRRAIAAQPSDVEAHRLLGLIVVRQSEDDEVQSIQRLLAREGLTDDQRAQLEFALGVAHDDIGDASRAFDHFSRGNALVRKLRPFDLAAAQQQMLDLEREFSQLPDDQIPPLAPPTGTVFVVGLPRSGKSTLEGMLARHPALFGAGEFPAAATLAANLPNQGSAVATPESLTSFARRYNELADALAPGRRIIDTLPRNFLLLGLLRLAFPAARVIHCLRESEDHAIALFQKYYLQAGNEYASDLGHLWAYLASYRRLMALWRRRFPDFALDIDMADIRRQPKAPMQAVCDFLELRWDSACAEPFTSEPRLGGPPTSHPADLTPYLAALARFQAAQSTDR